MGLWSFLKNRRLVVGLSKAFLFGKSISFDGHTHDYAAFSHSHAWSAITGKPSTFTPASHTHTVNQISGLKQTSYENVQLNFPNSSANNHITYGDSYALHSPTLINYQYVGSSSASGIIYPTTTLQTFNFKTGTNYAAYLEVSSTMARVYFNSSPNTFPSHVILNIQYN